MFLILLIPIGILVALMSGTFIRKAAGGPDATAKEPTARHSWLYAAMFCGAFDWVVSCAADFPVFGEGGTVHLRSFLLLAAWGLIPYALLVVMLRRLAAVPRLQIALVMLVVGFAVLHLAMPVFFGEPMPKAIASEHVAPLQVALIAGLCLASALDVIAERVLNGHSIWR